MNGPQTKNWSAVESSWDFGGGGRHIAVRGQVEVGSTGETLSLTQQEPAGSNVMTLALTIDSGSGATVMSWKDVEHVRDLSQDEHYSQVIIRLDGQTLETISVQIIHS